MTNLTKPLHVWGRRDFSRWKFSLFYVIALCLACSTMQVKGESANDYCAEAQSDCFGVSLYTITSDAEGFHYCLDVCNSCGFAISNVAIELPAGVIPTSPIEGMPYMGDANYYNIESPTNNPFYSIKFETVGEGVKDGACDQLCFTLPTQKFIK